MFSKAVVAVFCLGLALAMSQHARPAEAPPPGVEEGRGQEVAPAAPQQEPRINRRRASELVSEQYAGRILSIRLEGRRWRVRLDNGGTVYNVFVDANSGRLSLSEDQAENN